MAAGSRHGPASETPSGIVIVAGAPAARTRPASATAPAVLSAGPNNATAAADRLKAIVVQRFPMIREANVDCAETCTLVMALGDQNRGPSPFGGALERYLAEQGYALSGRMVVDQPGDNDTLLTIPVTLPTDQSARQAVG